VGYKYTLFVKKEKEGKKNTQLLRDEWRGKKENEYKKL